MSRLNFRSLLRRRASSRPKTVLSVTAETVNVSEFLMVWMKMSLRSKEMKFQADEFGTCSRPPRYRSGSTRSPLRRDRPPGGQPQKGGQQQEVPEDVLLLEVISQPAPVSYVEGGSQGFVLPGATLTRRHHVPPTERTCMR
jgi:hypothetical protein